MILLDSRQIWVCPNCPARAVTKGQPNRFHSCPAMHGLTAPMVLEGTDCQVVAVEREDYVGTEDVRFDGAGRPVMAIRTEYGDGRNDTMVFAPTARAAGGSN